MNLANIYRSVYLFWNFAILYGLNMEKTKNSGVREIQHSGNTTTTSYFDVKRKEVVTVEVDNRVKEGVEKIDKHYSDVAVVEGTSAAIGTMALTLGLTAAKVLTGIAVPAFFMTVAPTLVLFTVYKVAKRESKSVKDYMKRNEHLITEIRRE